MLYVILALSGLITGSVGLYLEPLLIAHRLEDGPAKQRGGPILSLVPIVGAFFLVPQPSDDETVQPTIPTRSFSIQALVLEIILAAVFVALGWRFSDHTQLALACVYTALLFEMALIDFHYRLVLNVISYPSAVIALAGGTIWSGIGIGSSLLGGAVALILFFVIELVGRGAMGRGDTKLATVIGLMRGYPSVWTALVLGIVTGGIMAGLLVLSGQGRRSTFAYGPALAIGAVASFFVGRI
jgi:leader peptidase (prepilin peptidase)/N-methyltransferase